MYKAVPGLNDLQTLRPDLMKDWDWEANTRDPSTLLLGSDYRAHWVCHICGHKWSNRLDTRTKNGSGCPVCAKKRGSGSSLADYTLYRIIQSFTPDSDSVKYRYRIAGWEVDVFIQSSGICLEYDGYAWHDSDAKKDSDIRKEETLEAEGYSVYRLQERDDYFLMYNEVSEKVVTVPYITVENYNGIKDLYVEVLKKWCIISGDSTAYKSIRREDIKSLISKPL